MSTTGPSLTVLGSANTDLAVYVAYAPRRGETVTGQALRTVPGGKGANQAVAAARAGGHVAMIGAVGDDSFGASVRATLTGSGVDTTAVRTVPEPTGTAHLVVDHDGGNSIVVIPGANATVTRLAEGDETRIAAAGTLLLQLELPLAGVVAGARTAREHGVRTVLTPVPAQPLPPERLHLTDLLVPNEHEARALTGATDPYEAARLLLDHVPEVVVTLGEKGSLHAVRGGEPVTVPAVPVRAADTTAAGDTFVGALAVAYAEDRPMAEAMAWASAASALSVQRAGATSSMPTRPQIDAFYKEAQ